MPFAGINIPALGKTVNNTTNIYNVGVSGIGITGQALISGNVSLIPSGRVQMAYSGNNIVVGAPFAVDSLGITGQSPIIGAISFIPTGSINLSMSGNNIVIGSPFESQTFGVSGGQLATGTLGMSGIGQLTVSMAQNQYGFSGLYTISGKEPLFALSGNAFQNRPIIFSGSGNVGVRTIDVGSGVVVNYYTTREIFYPIRYDSTLGDFDTKLGASNSTVNTTFFTPFDFNKLISLDLVLVPGTNVATTARDIDLFSDYGKIGEATNLNSQSDTTSTYDFTSLAGKITTISLTGIFSNLVAGHFCGLTVTCNAVGSNGINYLGVKLKYQ